MASVTWASNQNKSCFSMQSMLSSLPRTRKGPRDPELMNGEARSKSLQDATNQGNNKVSFGTKYENNLGQPRNNGPIEGDMPHQEYSMNSSDGRRRIATNRNGASQGSSSSHWSQMPARQYVATSNASPHGQSSIGATSLASSSSLNTNWQPNYYLISPNISSNPPSAYPMQTSPLSVGHNGRLAYYVISPSTSSQGCGSMQTSPPHSLALNGGPMSYGLSDSSQSVVFTSNSKGPYSNPIGSNEATHASPFSPNSYSSQGCWSNPPSNSSTSNSRVGKEIGEFFIIPELSDETSPVDLPLSTPQNFSDEALWLGEMNTLTSNPEGTYIRENSLYGISPTLFSESSASPDDVLTTIPSDIYDHLKTVDLGIYLEGSEHIENLENSISKDQGGYDCSSWNHENVDLDASPKMNGSTQTISNHYDQNLQLGSSNMFTIQQSTSTQVTFNIDFQNGVMNPPVKPILVQKPKQSKPRGRPPSNGTSARSSLQNGTNAAANRIPNSPVEANRHLGLQGNVGRIAIAPNVEPRFTWENELEVRRFLEKHGINLRQKDFFIKVFECARQVEQRLDKKFMSALINIRMTPEEAASAQGNPPRGGCGYQHIGDCIAFRDRSGINAIHLCIIYDEPDLLNLFLSFRPDLKYEGSFALPENQSPFNGDAIQFTIIFSRIRMLQMLLEHITRDNKDLMKPILEKKINNFGDSYNALELACVRFCDTVEHTRIIKLLLTKQNPFTAMVRAASSSHAEKLMDFFLDELRSSQHPRYPQQTWNLTTGQTIGGLLRTNMFVRCYNAPYNLTDIIKANCNLSEAAKSRILANINNWN